jgi:hypothetical protein
VSPRPDDETILRVVSAVAADRPAEWRDLAALGNPPSRETFIRMGRAAVAEAARLIDRSSDEGLDQAAVDMVRAERAEAARRTVAGGGDA